MSASATQPWDTSGVAEAIESSWRSDLHEQVHRAALVDLVQHCFPASNPTVLEVGCGSALIDRLAEAERVGALDRARALNAQDELAATLFE